MKNLLPVFLLMLLAACQSSSINPEGSGKVSACGVANPVQDLPWLKIALEKADEKTYTCTPWSVTQGTYKGQTVYLVTLSGSLCCDPLSIIYNCQGEVVFSSNFKEEAKIEDKKVVWKKN